jgi:hypothetical protein
MRDAGKKENKKQVQPERLHLFSAVTYDISGIP